MGLGEIDAKINALPAAKYLAIAAVFAVMKVAMKDITENFVISHAPVKIPPPIAVNLSAIDMGMVNARMMAVSMDFMVIIVINRAARRARSVFVLDMEKVNAPMRVAFPAIMGRDAISFVLRIVKICLAIDTGKVNALTRMVVLTATMESFATNRALN